MCSVNVLVITVGDSLLFVKCWLNTVPSNLHWCTDAANGVTP